MSIRPRPPGRVNERWSLDFVSDTLTDGRRFRALCVVDDFSREALAVVVDVSLSGVRVARELDRLIWSGWPSKNQQAAFAEKVSAFVEIVFDSLANVAVIGRMVRERYLPGCEAVYALEANPTTAAPLQAEKELWGNGPKAPVINAALQDDPDRQVVSFMKSDNHPGRSGIHSIFSNDPEVQFETLDVPATTIDKVT